MMVKTKQDFINTLAGRRINYEMFPSGLTPCAGYWQRPAADAGLISIRSADGCWKVYFYISTSCPQPIISTACIKYMNPSGGSEETVPDDVFGEAISQLAKYLVGANECFGVITVV